MTEARTYVCSKAEEGAASIDSKFSKLGTYFCVLTAVVPQHVGVCLV
jgi:hypothetical protein